MEFFGIFFRIERLLRNGSWGALALCDKAEPLTPNEF
jgi:hypothetical protein